MQQASPVTNVCRVKVLHPPSSKTKKGGSRRTNQRKISSNMMPYNKSHIFLPRNILVKKRFNCQRKFLQSKNDDDDDIGAVLMVVLVSICRCPLSHASQLHRFVHCDLFLAIPSTSLHRFYVKTFERKLIC